MLLFTLPRFSSALCSVFLIHTFTRLWWQSCHIKPLLLHPEQLVVLQGGHFLLLCQLGSSLWPHPAFNLKVLSTQECFSVETVFLKSNAFRQKLYRFTQKFKTLRRCSFTSWWCGRGATCASVAVLKKPRFYPSTWKWRPEHFENAPLWSRFSKSILFTPFSCERETEIHQYDTILTWKRSCVSAA